MAISAINAQTIEVKFSKDVDPATGAAAGSYTLLGGPAALTETATVNGDTVTLALDAPMTNNTAYTLVVEDTVEDTESNTLGTDYRHSFTFDDDVKPTVTGVTTDEQGNLTIQFSEALNATEPTVVLNNQILTVGQVGYAAGDDFVTVAKADALAVGVTAGGTFPIQVYGGTDLVGNAMDLHQGTFTYAVNASAPTVSSLTVTDENTLTIGFSEALASFASAANLEVYKGATQIATGDVTVTAVAGTNNYTLDLANTVYAAGETSVTLRVVVKGYKDAAGNFGGNTERTVTINKDVTGPTLVSSKFDATGDELELKFNETLAAGTPAPSSIVLTDSNGVLYTAVTEANVTDTLVLDATTLNPGTYTVQVLAGAVTDTSIGLNPNAAVTATIVKTAAPSGDTTKPTAIFSAGAANGQITVTYDEAVKAGNVTGSATLLSNYKLNGSALPANTTITLNGTAEVATITLPADTLSTTRANTLTVSGVQDLAGNVIDTDSEIIALNENTAPVLQSAVAQADGTIKLTFSENLVIDGSGSTDDEDDFVVTVQGNALTASDFTAAVGASAKEVVLSPAAGVSFATGTITVGTHATTTTITDAAPALNTLKTATTVNVTR